MQVSEQLEAAPVEWDCSHCGLTRSVVVRFDEDGLLPATVEPSCSGYVTCEAGDFSHPDDESCEGPDGAMAWCPFDARDDYGTGDLEGVIAIKRDRRRAIPEIKAMEARLERLEAALEKSGRVLKDISTFDAGSRLLIVDTRAMIATALAGQPEGDE